MKRNSRCIASLQCSRDVMAGNGGKHFGVEAGHQSVICTQKAFYFDYGQSENRDTEPLNIGGQTTLQKTYEFPLITEGAHEERSFILGVQGQIWTEYISSLERLEYMAFPRLCALA